jgi:hypothetical protein
VVLVRTDVSVERIAYIIRMERISDGGDMFLGKVGYYKNQMASHPRKQDSSGFVIVLNLM